MTRPRKFTVDYFPHDCVHKTTMYIIEQKYGNDGYAFWFKVLELLGSTDGHFINLNDEMKNEFLQAKTRLSSVDCIAILDTLCKLGAIDPELWSKRVIWSQNFVNNIETVYKNRKVKPPLKPTLNELFPVETPISTGRNTTETNVSTDRNPQSRVEESRVKNKTFSSELENPSSPDAESPVFQIPLADKTNYDVTQKDIDKWQDVFPAVCILAELKRIALWCDDNPTKKKTRRGVNKFISAWLERTQNRGGNGNGFLPKQKKDDRDELKAPLFNSADESWLKDPEY